MMAQNLRPVSLNFTPPRPYAQGGLASKAEDVKNAGRGGDTMLVHVNPIEYKWLQKNFGGGTNPKTGLPEFSFWDYLLPAAMNVIAPGVGGAIGDTIGSITGNALPSGITTALGGALSGAGINALTGNNVGTGAIVGGLSPTVLGALGLTGTKSFWYGKKHNEQTILKMKSCQKGRQKNKKLSEETKQKISQSSKGKIFSETTKRKISISKSKEYYFYNPEGNKIKIINLQNFCLKNNLSCDCMRQLIRGKAKKHKGWSYSFT
jgi:hypothetical protein